MFYVQFYPQKPENGPFWASKKEGVLPSPKPGAGGRSRTDDLLFTKLQPCHFAHSDTGGHP
jgi:hypothetical protein